MKALQKEGFSFIEVITPCPEIYGRYNKMRTGLDMMNWFRKASEIRHYSDPAKAEIAPERIVLGEFVDIEKPSYGQLLRGVIAQVQEKAGGE